MDRAQADSIWSMFDVNDSRKVLLECIKASRSLAELKGISKSMFLPNLALNYVCNSEARSISELEGKTIDASEVFKASVAKEGLYPPEIFEVLRISNSMKEYREQPITMENLEKVNSAINDIPRKIRTESLDLNRMTMDERNITHPEGEDVEELMRQLLDYINNESHTDELLKSVITLLLFEYINPFESHNRSTGFVFFHMLLNHYGLTSGCELMLAPILFRNSRDYIRKLHFAEMSGNTESWLIFMLEMINDAAKETLQMLYSIYHAVLETMDKCKGLSFCTNASMSVVFNNLYCKSLYLIEAGIAERVTAMKYLKALEDVGVLKSEKIGREVVFLNVPLHKMLLNM